MVMVIGFCNIYCIMLKIIAFFNRNVFRPVICKGWQFAYKN